MLQLVNIPRHTALFFFQDYPGDTVQHWRESGLKCNCLATQSLVLKELAYMNTSKKQFINACMQQSNKLHLKCRFLHHQVVEVLLKGHSDWAPKLFPSDPHSWTTFSSGNRTGQRHYRKPAQKAELTVFSEGRTELTRRRWLNSSIAEGWTRAVYWCI